MKILLFIKELGFLRFLLLLVTIFSISVVPVSGTFEVYTGSDAFFYTVIPALTPLIFMVLLLDALMSIVMIDGKNESGKIISKRNSIFNLLLAILLIVFWAPYYLDLMGL